MATLDIKNMSNPYETPKSNLADLPSGKRMSWLVIFLLLLMLSSLIFTSSYFKLYQQFNLANIYATSLVTFIFPLAINALILLIYRPGTFRQHCKGAIVGFSIVLTLNFFNLFSTGNNI